MAIPSDARAYPNWLGHPHPRVEGPAKGMGAALYASDMPLASPAHAALVTSKIRRGRITGLRA